MTITRKIKVHTVIFFLSVFLIPFLLSACQENKIPLLIIKEEPPLQKEGTFAAQGNVTYPGEINTSCTIDSDCVLDSLSRCGLGCQQSPFASVNKETAEKIDAWQREEGNVGCYAAMCVYPPFVQQIPLCINSTCTFRKELLCQEVCAELFSEEGDEWRVEGMKEIIEAEGFQTEQCSCKWELQQ